MKAAVFTISTEGYKVKKGSAAGVAVKKVLEQSGFTVKAGVLPEDHTVVETVMRQLADTGAVQALFTIGSNSFREKDCAPDALTEAAERLLPGIPEAVRSYNMQYTKRMLLDRSAAGIRNKTVLVNLPDSGKLAGEDVEYILPEILRVLEEMNQE
ncbi:MAG: molybdenum cofactor biosynthesis protein [Ruminococcus sp.]|nr:molybdenum cofactor biosynthesis protein [Ruminococcus sp.]